MMLDSTREGLDPISDRPAVSVILPVFNAGGYLDSAVKSILNQSFCDFELILLDDGSTDGSLERLKLFALNDSRCKVHTWPNRGLVGTLNEGIRLSKGEIIFRMDADDLAQPNRIEKQLKYLNENPDCVAVGSQVMLIDPEGLEICEFVKDFTHDDIDSAHLAGRGGSICHPAAAMRRAAFNKVQGYRDCFPHAEDIDLFLRLAEIGTLSNLPEILLCYRQHPNSIGYQHASKQRDSALRAVSEARLRRGVLSVTESNTSAPIAAKTPTLSEVHRKWAWWALLGGNISVARKHAYIAFKLAPMSLKNWKLIACALRGY